MLVITGLDSNLETPLYRQLYSRIKKMIDSGDLAEGFRLPATRELAASLRLNRTTVSAAYDLLEAEGAIRGHVGRGSFVTQGMKPGGVPWQQLLEPATMGPPVPAAAGPLLSFAISRPSESLFPLDEFRTTCREVIDGEQIQTILQLGSPSGYPPLRRYLLDKARAEGTARPSDGILITSGCQQAFDLLQRVLLAKGETVLIEDPVYSGLRKTFQRAGARVVGIPMERDGVDLRALESAISRERPKMAVVTANFQNPTGATLPLAKRAALLRMAHRAGLIVIENDIYGELRYEGESALPLKKLDDSGDTVLLRSFSKLAFPGLRVGWVIGPRMLIEKLTEAKQCSDLHADQLSQAVLFRFAESGRLESHRGRIQESGRARLRAIMAACERHLPAGTEFTRPEGGMNLWVRLPEPLDAGELLPRAERAGVSYLPGKYFAVGKIETGSLRLSFAGLTPEQIERGIRILGSVFGSELERVRAYTRLEPAPALV